MTPTIRKSLLIVAAFAILGCAQSVAQADPLVFSLQNTTLTGVPGGSVTFFGSAFNSGTSSSATDTINNIGFSGLPGLTVNTTPFNFNFAFQTVASGNTLGPGGYVYRQHTFRHAPGKLHRECWSGLLRRSRG
jgi:hypothetical protein